MGFFTADTTWKRILYGIIIAGLTIGGTLVQALTASSADTGGVAQQFAQTNFFFPANYVFGTIWSVIYGGIAAYGVYQLFPSNADDKRYQRATPILALNMVINFSWIFAFNNQYFWASLAIIAAMLATGAWFYVQFGIGDTSGVSTVEKIIWVPLAMYLAWLTIATVANISIVMIISGVTAPLGIAAATWGALMLGIAGLLGIALAVVLQEPVYLGVFAYAYVGVAVRWWGDAQIVAIVAVVGAVIFAALLVMSLLPNMSFVTWQTGNRSQLGGASS